MRTGSITTFSPGRARHLREHVPHLLALLAVLFLVQSPRLGGAVGRAAAPLFPQNRIYVDFNSAYYPAAQRIQHNPSELYRGIEYDPATGRTRLTAGAHFVNIPIVAWLFVPFTVLPLDQAGNVLLAINMIIALVCLYLVQCRAGDCRPSVRWAITLLFATSGPLINAMNLGQTTPFVLLVLLLSEAALFRGDDTRAGLWLGLACLIKIPPLLFLPYFLLRGRWRVAAAATAVIALGIAISIVSYGWPLHVTYYETVLHSNAGTAVAAHNSQSIVSALMRLWTGQSLLSWQPLAVHGSAQAWQTILLAVVLGVSGWALVAPCHGAAHWRLLLELGIVLCVSLVALPIYWVHYGTWLLPVFIVVGALFLPRDGRQPDHRYGVGLALLVLAVLLVHTPILPPYLIKRFSGVWWFRVFVSHQLFGTLLLLGLCVWGIRKQLPGRTADTYRRFRIR